MERTIDIIKNPDELNPWIRKSISLFLNTSYLDNILAVYPFSIAVPQRLNQAIRRKIVMAHSSRNTPDLIELLMKQTKFPYEDPIWYLIKNVKGCLRNNPNQVERIAQSLYAMTTDETLFRIESPPKLNTQIGPMFNQWLRKEFNLKRIDSFEVSLEGVYVLDASEEEGKRFVNEVLAQDVIKRPDLVAKVNIQYIIGEEKWIGQPGGNQFKQVQDVVDFCRN